jgi:hypothetical protein
MYQMTKTVRAGFCVVNIRTQIMYNPLQMALNRRCTAKEQVKPNQLIASKREVRFSKVVKIYKKNDYVNYRY